MGIYVTNIYDLNLAASTYKISFWLWFKSNDEKYEPEKAIDIVGGKDIKVEATATQRLADGTYYRSAKYSATVNQMWDVRFYPFDRQELKIIIESTIEEVSSLIFVADEKNSGVDPHIVLPGWIFHSASVHADTSVYKTDFGVGEGGQSIYPRFTTRVILDHAGGNIFSTDFLGFFVADILTGVALFVESFEVTRMAIPLLGRLNMVVGSLFGAVGNTYIMGNMLPPRPVLSLPDVVQISSFSAIAVALIATIGTESLGRLGYSPALVTAVARSSVALYLASQIGLGAYFLATAREGKAAPAR
ncbi:MAG: hypothetical protein WCJ64_14825 [Rhodospirillaceae bacterium]